MLVLLSTLAKLTIYHLTVNHIITPQHTQSDLKAWETKYGNSIKRVLIPFKS